MMAGEMLRASWESSSLSDVSARHAFVPILEGDRDDVVAIPSFGATLLELVGISHERHPRENSRASCCSPTSR